MASRSRTRVVEVPMQFTTRTTTRIITVDTNPGPIKFTSVAPPRPPPPKRSGQGNIEEKFMKLFMSLAGPDEEIDAFELQDILSHAYRKETKGESFRLDSCRALVSMMDKDMSGKLGLKEFMELWISLRNWKSCFEKYDRDGSGDMSFSELGNALRGAGFTVPPTLTKALLRRYWNRREQIGFEDFIQCIARLRMLMDSFRSFPSSGGKITITMDEYLSKCLTL